MITGVHTIIYCQDADKARAFFRDVLELDSVDAGGGWLIFALPPGEMACHPTEAESHHEMYLICDDIQATMARLSKRNIPCTPVREQDWGVVTSVAVPGVGKMGLYQPKHPTAFKRKATAEPAPRKPSGKAPAKSKKKPVKRTKK